MALVLPIPLNVQLVTDQDLGRGFSIDENGQNAKKNQIYLCDTNNIVTSKTTIDQNHLTMIRDQESLKAALDVGGELSLSYGMISGKVMGNYIDNSFTGSEKLSFLYTRRIVSKVIQLDQSKLSKVPGIELIKDLEDLRTHYGQYYISKIEYGAMLDLKITLQSDDDTTLKQIKGELSGSVTFAAFSLSVKAHIDKTDESKKSKLNVTSNVYMAGCKQLGKTDVKSLDEAQDLIDRFEVDEERLIPIRIEISPLPPTLTPLLSLDPIEYRNYKRKLTQIGSNYWEFEQMSVQLNFFKKMIEPIFEDENLSQYVQTLMAKVSQLLAKVRKAQDETATFMQDTFANILVKPILNDEASITALKVLAGQLIGSTCTITNIGNWFGPTVEGVPTYKGTYKYANETIYKGYCLEGKRHGKGIMTYPDGNIEQLVSIDGEWKEDEVSFPTTVTYLESVVEIKTANQFVSWKEDQKARPVAETVEVINLTSSEEYYFRYRVFVDKISDVKFRQFFDQLRRSVDPKRGKYFFLFMGMTGTGKTTMIEYLLNILTGQVHSPKVLRAQEIEAKGTGNSKTQNVCRYEIEYIFQKSWMFSISFIDTPGFADVGGLEKDGQHIKSIIKTVGKIDRLDNVSYVVNGALTRKTLEPLRVLCNVFSVLPAEAFECVSTIITFCDNKDQASGVRNVLNEMLDGIKDRPALFMDNPWSQYIAAKHKELLDDNEKDDDNLSGVDNAQDIQKRLEEKIELVNNFMIDRIRAKKSFEPKGMSALNELKDTLLSKLSDLAATINNLSTILSMLKELSDDKIQSLIEKTKNISLQDWVKDKGYALIDGKPKAKIVGNEPFKGGVHSTVCFSPECQNMVCHESCSLNYTVTKGDNIFKSCLAFSNNMPLHQECQVCSLHCSYKQHVHTQCQLKWVENDTIIDTFYAIKKGFNETKEEYSKHILKEKELSEVYEKQIKEFSQLNEKFKDLAVLGDMKLILDSSKKTYEQQLQIAVQAKDQVKADKLSEVLKSLQSFIDAMSSSQAEENSIKVQLGEIEERRKKNESILNDIFGI